MADTSSNLSFERGVSRCFDAQTFLGSYENGELNQDIGGALNVVANIVINLLLPVLVGWTDEVSQAVFLLMSQVHPILLATLCSINAGTLTVFDSHFTTAVTASPMSAYVASSCLLHLCGVETSLFKKIAPREARAIVLGLGLSLPLLWFSVSVVTSFSTTAFTNSYYCLGMTVPRYLEFVVSASMVGLLDVMGRRDIIDDVRNRKGLGIMFLICVWSWGIFLVRRREDIVEEWHKRRRKVFDEDLMRRARFKRVRRYLLLVWNIPKVCWDVIRQHHLSMVVWVLLCLHVGWIFGMLNGVTFTGIKITYGQILSAFAPLPVLVAFADIFRHPENRRNVRKNFVGIPAHISAGLCFIITGKEDWIRRTELKRDYFDWSKRKWAVVLSAWLMAVGFQGIWIWWFVRTGTYPNERTVLNDPHKNWKPFSIMMYMYSYIVSIFCMFICAAGFDYYQKWFLSPRPYEWFSRDPEVALMELERRCSSDAASPGHSLSLRLQTAEGEINLQELLSPTVTIPVAPEQISEFDPFGRDFEWDQPGSRNHTTRDGAIPLPSKILHALGLTGALIVSLFLCAATFFAPFAALPLSQDPRWNSACLRYPTEIILTGQSNGSLPSTISFSSVPSQSQLPYPPKQHTFDFDYLQDPETSLIVVQYHPMDNATASEEPEPSIKTIILDMTQHKFVGCSSILPVASIIDHASNLEAICSNVSATYSEDPYLFFSINTDSPPKTTFLRTVNKQYAFPDDAPAFVLSYADASERLLDGVLLSSALTQRNNHNVLKVCSTMASPDALQLGTLSIFLTALNEYTVYVGRPKVLSL